MKRLILALCFTLLAPQAAHAISLAEAQAAAEAWVQSRKDAIQDRVIACISEGNPRVCHTAWAASVTENTDPIASSLAVNVLDDPGRQASTSCGVCFTGEGTFADAGISLPATAPVNAKINIARSIAGWGAQLVIRIRYDGVLYERGYGRGIFDGFDWQEVIE